MIEYRNIIEEEQPGVGDAEVVEMRVRNALAPSRNAMSEESDSAAEEGWQLVFVVHPQRPQLLTQEAGWIGSTAIEPQRATRIESHERVTSQVFAAFDALEEKRIGRFAGERRERTDRRERVGAELPHHGNDVVVAPQIVEIHRKASRNSSF